MTGAEALAWMKTILSILQMIGGWPLGLSVAVAILGPWLVMFFIARSLEKQAAKHDLETVKLVDSIKDVISVSVKIYETRHLEAVQMYKDNVELVKSYSKLAADQAAIIHLNTQAMTRLVDKIDDRRGM
ncbi:MAG: hypothetical protein ABFS18_02100 [Thermodesulfobacteriota bacterium]